MSMSPNEALKALLNDPERMKRLAEEFMAERQAKIERENAFFDSALCERMVGDIIRSNHALDSEDWAYFSERERAALGWGEEIRDEDVQTLFSVFIRQDLPMDKAPETDEENPFEHFSLERRGLRVFFMTGQGSITRLQPAEPASGSVAPVLAQG